MTQAKIVDIHRYYRVGGIDWGKLKANFDAVIISTGVGLNINPLLKEQVDGAVANGVPYMTYILPDVMAGALHGQMLNYLSLPGVMDGWTCLDIEAPRAGVRWMTASETLQCAWEIEEATTKKPLLYSRKTILDTWGTQSWMCNYKWWIAQYPYENWLLKRQYTGYDTFLVKYANAYPPAVVNAPYKSSVVLWQFSEKGTAQALCASAHTQDPHYPTGILECDLNISTVDKVDFLALLGATTPLPIPTLEARVTDLERRVSNLEMV